jgi:hypothetical protein
VAPKSQSYCVEVVASTVGEAVACGSVGVAMVVDAL